MGKISKIHQMNFNNYWSHISWDLSDIIRELENQIGQSTRYKIRKSIKEKLADHFWISGLAHDRFGFLLYHVRDYDWYPEHYR